MKFSYFQSVKSAKGEIANRVLLESVIDGKNIAYLAKRILDETDADKRGELKKGLPIVTWQAYFPGKRVNEEAVPSGLFMLDIDHIYAMTGWTPNEFYEEHFYAKFCAEYWIMAVHMTPSGDGLRVVAQCYDDCHNLAECQEKLARALGLPKYDDVCKDWARSSFLVPRDYWYYISDELFLGEPHCVYENKPETRNISRRREKTAQDAASVDQREGLFGGNTEYKGIPLEDIAKEWLRSTGGEPEHGERNTRLYQLALRMRYITDFNEATMLRVIPSYGLPVAEMKELIMHAATASRGQRMPEDLELAIKNIQKRKEIAEGASEKELEEIAIPSGELPPLPPVIKQFTDAAPDDFKAAVVLCQLPILGTLASRLRAQYLDGALHSPSFQVSLEAPQASGKSFMRKLAEYELAQVIDHDNEQREREREYDNKIKEMKLLNIKVTKENKDEVLGSRPETLIRFVPATMSITKLLIRMYNAKGLHLFALSEEIDTVSKAFKRGFSSYSDLLRVAYDNGIYGQDYASENTFSGIINIYYNFLTSGTPKAMRRFYPDVEDGLVSRVLFVTLPDQFAKPMPVWRELNAEEKALVDRKLIDLNNISIIGDQVQPVTILRMEFLNKEMKKWLQAQQTMAMKTDDRTRDIFCRRAAVTGFRAGMLALALYGAQKPTPTIRRNVVKFATWVATMMLNQHIMRFHVNKQTNTVRQMDILDNLPDEFTRDLVENELAKAGKEINARDLLYNWQLSGVITVLEKNKNKRGKATNYKFKKS